MGIIASGIYEEIAYSKQDKALLSLRKDKFFTMSLLMLACDVSSIREEIAYHVQDKAPLSLRRDKFFTTYLLMLVGEKQDSIVKK